MRQKLTPPDEGACIRVEPLQGAGGYIVPPKEFLPRLQQICRDQGILLILDEVQSGFGRTGKMFASQAFGIEPDIMAVSKALAHGLPAGAAIARAEVMNWEPGAHEGTLNGGPVIMEAAKAVLQVIAKEKLLKKSAEQGAYLKDQLLQLQKRYPLIGDVRGLGLMVGIELIKDSRKTPALEERNKLLDEAFKRGLLLLGAGESSIRLAPPLIITREQIDIGLSIIEDCLKRITSGR